MRSLGRPSCGNAYPTASSSIQQVFILQNVAVMDTHLRLGVRLAIVCDEVRENEIVTQPSVRVSASLTHIHTTTFAPEVTSSHFRPAECTQPLPSCTIWGISHRFRWPPSNVFQSPIPNTVLVTLFHHLMFDLDKMQRRIHFKHVGCQQLEC